MKQVFFLGPKGSFTEIAADNLSKKLGLPEEKIDLKPCKSIKDVIDSIDNPYGNYGVVPVENSIEGIVRETLDELGKSSSNIFINNEFILQISHYLISYAENVNQIKTIASHPQAIAQCQGFIYKTFGDSVEVITTTSTSNAVKIASENHDKTFAAIGTQKAAEIYGVPVLKNCINDVKENYTKFLLLGSTRTHSTGNDQSSMIICLRNKPGALVDLLVPFSENGINLCRIESRPSRRNLGDYLFFVDFNGHIDDETVKKAVGQVVPNVNYYKFLGSYPKYTTE